jgi:transposase-like protein
MQAGLQEMRRIAFFYLHHERREEPEPGEIHKAIKTRGSFPSEQAAEKLIYLAIRGHEKTSRTVRGWLTAVNQFAIMFEERFSPMPG